MSKIGLLVTAFECENELDEVLKPWTEYRNLGKDDIIISVVSAQFKAYHELKIGFNNEKTIEKLQQLFCNYTSDYQNTTIQYLNTPDEPLEEWGARNLALKPLLDEGCDLIWLLDADEYYKMEEIEKIVNRIHGEDAKFYAWFKLNFKNYIFSGKEWIDGFCPPRIFRTQIQNYKLNRFFWDNDTIYKNSELEIEYKNLPSKEIGRNIAYIKHLTWLNNERSRLKCLYHEKHFGPPKGIGCSYKWDEKKNCLQFNENYYKMIGQSLPSVFSD